MRCEFGGLQLTHPSGPQHTRPAPGSHVGKVLRLSLMPAAPRFTSLFHALCLLTGTGAALQGCGGRSDTSDSLFEGQPSSGGSGAIAGAVHGGAVGSGAVSSGGAASGGSRPSSGTAGTSGQAGTGAGGSAQGGVPGTGGNSGGMPQGGVGIAGTAAGGGAGNAPITCGADVCDGSTETCCVTLAGFGCVPQGAACSGAVLECGATSDCVGNQVCCLDIVDAVGSSSRCKSSCTGRGPTRERQLCTTDDDCQNQRRCRDTVFGISVCTRL